MRGSVVHRVSGKFRRERSAELAERQAAQARCEKTSRASRVSWPNHAKCPASVSLPVHPSVRCIAVRTSWFMRGPLRARARRGHRRWRVYANAHSRVHVHTRARTCLMCVRHKRASRQANRQAGGQAGISVQASIIEREEALEASLASERAREDD